MTTKIDATEFLKVEAAQALLEILGCAGLVDLAEIDPANKSRAQQQASVLATRLFEALRPSLETQILANATLLAADGAAALAELDATE